MFSRDVTEAISVFQNNGTRGKGGVGRAGVGMEGVRGKGRAIGRSAIKGMVPPTCHTFKAGDEDLYLESWQGSVKTEL